SLSLSLSLSETHTQAQQAWREGRALPAGNPQRNLISRPACASVRAWAVVSKDTHTGHTHTHTQDAHTHAHAHHTGHTHAHTHTHKTHTYTEHTHTHIYTEHTHTYTLDAHTYTHTPTHTHIQDSGVMIHNVVPSSCRSQSHSRVLMMFKNSPHRRLQALLLLPSSRVLGDSDL